MFLPYFKHPHALKLDDYESTMQNGTMLGCGEDSDIKQVQRLLEAIKELGAYFKRSGLTSTCQHVLYKSVQQLQQ